MAKKKGKTRRQGWASKLANVGLIVLGFSKVISIMMIPGANVEAKMAAIIRGATFGLSDGKFSLNEGLAMYTPAGGAIALGTLKSYLFKKFPVRR